MRDRHMETDTNKFYVHRTGTCDPEGDCPVGQLSAHNQRMLSFSSMRTKSATEPAPILRMA
ncbi:hypothetical protein DJFAAGMI_01991 [Comamonas sp. PE63]|uniref:Uncharacterized protein n=1 Tax=Comamonas brasiliensis TaxID=1812482 RepID=A0ABS5LSP7_9BURK|nr:hypothetical protein [Comamonas sp. PE63]